MLKDMLDDEVDEKFYLTDEQLKYFIANDKAMRESGRGFRFEPAERERERTAKTIQTKMDRMEGAWIAEYTK